MSTLVPSSVLKVFVAAVLLAFFSIGLHAQATAAPGAATDAGAAAAPAAGDAAAPATAPGSDTTLTTLFMQGGR